MKRLFTIEACVDYEGCTLVTVAYSLTQLTEKLQEIENEGERMGDNLEVRLWDEEGRELASQLIEIKVGGVLEFQRWEKKE
jgi:hypothetical protein